MKSKKIDKPVEAALGSPAYSNPIAVVFGRTLEKLRAGSNIEADQLAAKLGLKYSSYRLVETGAMPFRPSRSVMLARTHDLDWRRIAEVVVAVQLVEDKTHSVDEMKDALHAVFAHAPELKVVLALPERMWVAVEQRDSLDAMAAIALEDALVDRLEIYLRNDLTASSTPSSPMLTDVHRLIDGIAPYFLETLTGVLDSWNDLLPPRITPQQLAAFEVKNTRADRFVRIFGLIRDPKILRHTLQHQHHEFTWEYLLQPHFEFLGIIIAGTHERALRPLVESFQQDLIKLWKRSHRALLDEEAQRAIRKVHCKTVELGGAVAELLETMEEFDAVNDTMSPAAHRGTSSLTNVWLYRLRKPINTIAYADNLGGGDTIPYATSCSRKRTGQIAARLEESWSNTLNDLRLPKLFKSEGDQA